MKEVRDLLYKNHDIVLVIGDLSAGGAQRVLVTLANTWHSRGKRVMVLTLAGTDRDFFELSAGISRIALGASDDSRSFVGAITSNLSRISRIRKAVRQSGAPVVLSFVGSTNILAILATLGLGLTTAISERNDPRRQSLGQMWDLLRRFVYPAADLVTANSAGAVESLASYVSKSKLRQVQNPLDLPDSPADAAGGNSKSILTIGRLTHQKAQHILLEAFSQFVSQFPDWRLNIIGDGELEGDLKRQAEVLGIRHQVNFVSATHHLQKHYSEAGIFVLCSLFEGTPNVLLEAMGHGVPSIVSDTCGGGLDYVEDDVTGLVFRSGDVAQLADGLVKMTSDLGLRQRLGSAGLERVRQNEASAVVDRWDQMFGFDPADGRTPGQAK